ncbi:hypothetical protein CERZMDRAFT_103213 [Cercospora zeae-maydis SCOH1-5]|uniref:MARVEL domain-containing protein n=1 Tax=Cercospora zeae-maydis SCOH1-5 TaxID=717836 RepID=A0A6A6EYR2_9PEZI|nr:hypothetical protein CERZMDRAFT_103213 [Cercospora zeae-maydis SCOH1-5]
MDKKKLGALVARAVQFFAAGIVLGLSISTYKRLKYLKPACTDKKKRCGTLFDPWTSFLAFDACVGALGLLSASVGIVVSITSLGEKKALRLLVMVIDLFAATFLLAGGVTTAIKYANTLVRACGEWGGWEGDFILPPCSRIEACSAFLFVGLLATIVALVLVFLRGRSSKRASAPVGHEL